MGGPTPWLPCPCVTCHTRHLLPFLSLSTVSFVILQLDTPVHAVVVLNLHRFLSQARVTTSSDLLSPPLKVLPSVAHVPDLAAVFAESGHLTRATTWVRWKRPEILKVSLDTVNDCS